MSINSDIQKGGGGKFQVILIEKFLKNPECTIDLLAKNENRSPKIPFLPFTPVSYTI